MAEVTALELPTFKGRPGWEFTELKDFTLEAWSPAPDAGLEYEAGRVLELPEGSAELVLS